MIADVPPAEDGVGHTAIQDNRLLKSEYICRPEAPEFGLSRSDIQASKPMDKKNGMVSEVCKRERHTNTSI